jgi:Uma2 family endonuclease
MPILYEDEDEEDMGESNAHVVSDEILRVGIVTHLGAEHPALRAYSNMNLYYRTGPLHPRTGSLPYVSPDLMVVEPDEPVEPEKELSSYTIGRDGPAPRLTLEILSTRTAQQRDLDEKLVVYALLGVAEYILVDRIGTYLPERLLLKRLQPDGSWQDEQDADGGVTSQLGIRIIWDRDDELRVVHAATGTRYARPREAQREAEARQAAERMAQREAVARQTAEQEAARQAAARQAAEQEAAREAVARQTAEQEAARQAAARQAAEEEARNLMAEVQRLQAELARQQTQKPTKKGRRKP